jgi:hypothetical protein
MAAPKQFFVQRGDEVEGPLSGIQLREQAFRGEITPESTVKVGRDGEWVSAARLHGLFDSEGDTLPHPPETQAYIERLRKLAARCWYVRRGARVIGPFAAEELRVMAREGDIDPNTRIMRGAQGTWVPAGRVRGLIPLDDDQLEAIASEVLSSPIEFDDFLDES